MAIAFLNNITFSGGSQAEKLRLENLAADPATGNGGQLYYNTGDQKVYLFDGTNWVNIDGGVATVTAGTYINLTGTATDPIINHDNTTRSDTTSASSPAAGGTFQVVDSVTSNVTGHVTAINVKTVTLPADTDTTYDLTTAPTGTAIRLTGSDATDDDVTISGTAAEVEVTRISASELRAGLPNDVTIANNLTVGGTGEFTGQVTIPTTPVAATDAASKSYVDNLVAGGLVFRGTFRADTGEILSGANSGSFIYNCPGGAGTRVAVAVGDYYVVATAGGSFYCSGATLDIGDSIIGVTAAAADSSTDTNWSIVQSDEGVTDISASAVNNLLGINLSASTGSVAVGLDINSLGTGTLPITDQILIPYYDGTSDVNRKVTYTDLVQTANSATSFAATISATATVTHGLNTKDVIVQLYDTVTDETVYADVDRISTTQVTITFAATPTNSVRVLVQKIG